MKIKTIINKALSLPPEIVLRKARDRIVDLFKLHRERLYDKDNPTYITAPEWFDKIPYSYFKFPSDSILIKYKVEIKSLSEYYLMHKFNLLGSGWVEIFYSMKTSGYESLNYSADNQFDIERFISTQFHKPNQEIIKSIYKLISTDYKLIDWQIDFRSGFRFNEAQWYRDIQFGNVRGVDIKLPWELGRMQHLIMLAYACKLSQTYPNDFKTAETYFNEFRNQILDFIAFNPPRYGVQWMNAMDVGIRAVNWLVCYDLFKNMNFIFQDEEDYIFRQSIYEHLLHILWNLEWSHGLRANHYFANIASIIIISSYMPISEDSNNSLIFGLQELINETLYQFYPDGGNFEASTSYHRLSTEFLLHSIFILMNLQNDKIQALKNYSIHQWRYTKKLQPLPKQLFKIEKNRFIFPDEFWERVSNIIDFCLDAQNNAKTMSRIGDIDNGRFIKFTPIIVDDKNNEPFEYDDSMSCVLSLFCGMFSLNDTCPDDYIEFELANATSKEKLPNIEIKYPEFKSELISPNQFKNSQYPDFGLYIYRNCIYEVFIRCGQIGQNGKGGHSHNDQLSFELSIDGNFVIVDPGCYVYTALQAKRNQYRSTHYHNTLSIKNIEQNKWLEQSVDDLFWYIGERSRAKALKIENNTFIGEHYGFDLPHSRIFRFRRNYFTIRDICEIISIKQINFHLHPDAIVSSNNLNIYTITLYDVTIKLEFESGESEIDDYEYSPAYGIKTPAKKIIAKNVTEEFKTKVSICKSKYLD